MVKLDVCKRIQEIKERIGEAAERVGRKSEEVSLVAAVKGIENQLVESALTYGIEILGENRVQEAIRRNEELVRGKSVSSFKLHMIGHLQRNKVKRAAEIFDMFQSIDSLPLARELNHRALNLGTRIDILVEVNTSAEETKFGIPPDPESLGSFVESIGALKGLQFQGLMTLGPYVHNPDDARPAFRKLNTLGEILREKGYQTPILSMGMSHDFDIAIEEGSTMIRIGRGIFGERNH